MTFFDEIPVLKDPPRRRRLMPRALRPRQRPPRSTAPKPPRRPPPAPVQREPLTPEARYVQGVLRLVVGLIAAFLLNVTLLSGIQHLASQQMLHNTFRQELSEGTAPVSEGDFDKHLLADGVPVALIQIPSLGVKEIVVEGTGGSELRAGPGHRRDTVLPGQQGTSVILGRATAYGGPFGGIQQLQPGDSIRVLTGQGKQLFHVIGVRYAGDPTPAAPGNGESRLVLVSARGAAFMPNGVVYVDAELVGDAKATGTRQTTYAALPAAAQPLATDTRTVWALVFALQFLLIALIGAVWALRRIGPRKTWIVAIPVLGLALLYSADQITLLLPNLL